MSKQNNTKVDKKLAPVVAENGDEFYKGAFMLANRLAERSVETALESFAVLSEDEEEYEKYETVDDLLKSDIIQKATHYVAEEIMNTFKYVCNDYAYNVNEGNINPYEFDRSEESGYNEFKDTFKKKLQETTLQLALAGVPMKERDDGTLETDYEKIRLDELEKRERDGERSRR